MVKAIRTLSQHVALVTGGARGIGRAVVLRLVREGAAVVINSISASGAKTFAAELCGEGHRALGVQGDVSNPKDVHKMFDACRNAFGDCTLLVNNAGHEHRAPFEDLSIEDWDRMIGVHLRGTFLCTQAAIPGMLTLGDGVIVNVVSRMGQTGGEGVCHYSAAKAGVIGLTKSLAREYSRRGIRVNAVAPGPINTELAFEASGGVEEERLAGLPLGRYGEPDDVADTVAFLASPQSRLYVGQTLSPNCGGLMLG